MSQPQYINGDVNEVKLTIATAKTCTTGDMVGMSSGTLVKASDETWGTAVATPSAPTVADAGVNIGTGLTNAATGVKVSYQFPWGEGALSNAGSATPTANAAIKMTGLAIPAPAIGLNVYVETAAASGTYKLWNSFRFAEGQQGIGQIFITGYGVGQTPPATTVTSAALDVTQYNFVSKFVGPVMQSKSSSTVARVFGNSEDNRIIAATSGIWEYDCASATFAVGDYVGPAKDTGNALLDNKVVAVDGAAKAIGRVVEAGTSITRVKVKVFSKMLNLERTSI